MLTSQLKAGDNVVKYIELKSIFGGNRAFIALTEERLIYHSRIYDRVEKTKTVETSNLPISKITNMTTRTIKTSCFGKDGFLEVNMQGQIYDIYVGKDLAVVKPLIAEFTSRT